MNRMSALAVKMRDTKNKLDKCIVRFVAAQFYTE